jgi:hypothetical protein
LSKRGQTDSVANGHTKLLSAGEYGMLVLIGQERAIFLFRGICRRCSAP